MNNKVNFDKIYEDFFGSTYTTQLKDKENVIKEETDIEDIDNFSCAVVGPPMMMKFTVEEFLKRNVAEENIWVSYERKMCCGLGKCGHCKMDESYICLDGPVYDYSKAKTLID